MLREMLHVKSALLVAAVGVLLASCVTIEGNVPTFNARFNGSSDQVVAFDRELRVQLDVKPLKCTLSEGEEQRDCGALQSRSGSVMARAVTYEFSYSHPEIFKKLGLAFEDVQLKLASNASGVFPKFSDASPFQRRLTSDASDPSQLQPSLTIYPGPQMSANCAANPQPCQTWTICTYKYGYPCTRDKPNCDPCQ